MCRPEGYSAGVMWSCVKEGNDGPWAGFVGSAEMRFINRLLLAGSEKLSELIIFMRKNAK